MFAASKTNSFVAVNNYEISRSLRFNSADSAYLNRTPASAGNRKTWTWSGWVKRSLLSSGFQMLFDAGSSYTEFTNFAFYISSDNQLVATTGAFEIWRTTQVFRDPSAWYHMVLVVDTTQATANNRTRLYINGTEVTSFTRSTNLAFNTDYGINANIIHYIGRDFFQPIYFGGYITEVNFIDGQALTPSSFGETNVQTGVWQPKAFSGGAYGTNGFYLNFSDNSNTTAATLGKDYSGNGNNWTPNNFSVTAGAGNDSLVDSPTSYGSDTGAGGTVRGNYCTLNPLAVDASALPTITNGNLDISANGVLATISMPTGTWYWEVTCTSTDADQAVGAYSTSESGKTSISGASNPTYGFIYQANGNARQNGTVVQTWSTFTNNDIISFTYDASIYQLKAYKNNSLVGTITLTTPPTGDSYVPMAMCLGGSFTFNFGQRPFAYTAPSGFKALCTQNLPTPTIGATSATLATKYFNPILYTGDGTTPRSLTGVGFQPDFVWIKKRSAADGHVLNNAVAGVGSGKTLYSNLTSAEGAFDQFGYLASLNSDGFTTQAGATDSLLVNASGATYVAWNWKANGSGLTNTAGSVTSTVSANTTSGFSVVTWTGSSAGQTVGHGLGVAPSLIIAKTRSASGENWPVYHKNLGIGTYLFLSSDAGLNTTYPTYWGSSAPTSTVFGTFTGGYPSANNYGSMVAYCFAPIAGYSEFGSYTGNGSNDGPFVYTGFRPAFVIIKVTSAVNVWLMLDATRNTSNVVTLNLNANTSAAENTYSGWCDFTSNGFKVRGTDSAINTGSGNYIYMAFASNPFKYSLAR